MKGRELRQALADGQCVYGTCVVGYGQPKWPRHFAELGLDFVFLDTEHTPINRETVAWAAQTYAANGVAPLLRIPEASPSLAAMGVDLGAHGIIVPYVETVDQAKRLVGAVKYRPLKGAALQIVLDQNTFPSEETSAYLRSYNPDAVLVIMIESPAGVENLSEILAAGGVDVILIGPHDFSVSHGVPGQFDQPIFNQAIKRVIQTCRENDVGVGIHSINGDINQQLQWAEWGCNFFVHGSDTFFITNGINLGLSQLRKNLDSAIPKSRQVKTTDAEVIV
jgi:4-hydroxy-2-oxoheptanedioate aldolase